MSDTFKIIISGMVLGILALYFIIHLSGLNLWLY